MTDKLAELEAKAAEYHRAVERVYDLCEFYGMPDIDGQGSPSVCCERAVNALVEHVIATSGGSITQFRQYNQIGDED